MSTTVRPSSIVTVDFPQLFATVRTRPRAWLSSWLSQPLEPGVQTQVETGSSAKPDGPEMRPLFDMAEVSLAQARSRVGRKPFA